MGDQEQGHLLRYLAIGHLAIDSAGNFDPNHHALVCYQAAKNDSQAKAYKSHCKAIMAKGAAKLQPNKRIRLTSDANDYDLHVLADQLDDDRAKTIVFFAVTSPDFGKHHTVTSLLRDLKSQFYEQYTNADFSDPNMMNTSQMNKPSQTFLSSIFARYDSSKLRDVMVKVDEVKNVMKSNVDRALMNVEHLEEMEVQSERFEEHARQFNKNSTKLKNMFRCRYYKLNAILALFVLAIIGYVIYAIYDKVH